MSARKALVTGASEGIGRALALGLAKENYRVTVVARSEERLQEVVAALEGAGAGPHRALVADLAGEAGVRRVCEDLDREGYDVLINNAGAGAYGSFAEVPLERQQYVMRLNCDAVVELSHAYLKGAKSGDALVNVSSTLALLAMPGSALYAATKAFVLSLSESLWYEQKERGVYVMALCPGATTTNFHVSSGGDPQHPPPQNISQSAEEVAQEALAALKERARPTVVTGIKNKAVVFATRFMGRKGLVNLMGGMRRA